MQPSKLPLKDLVGDPQQCPDRRPNQRDRVHRGDRVIQRRRVQDPLHPDQPRLRRRVQHHPEQSAWILRGLHTGSHIDQYGVREADPAVTVIATNTAGVAPTIVEAVPLNRLPVAQALQSLQHHHRRDHRRRHTPTPPITEQVREQVIRKQTVTLTSKDREHRRLRQHLLTKTVHVIQKITLTFRLTQRHEPPPREKTYTDIDIIPETEHKIRDRHAPKDSSHLATERARKRLVACRC